jgi:hypothetical protein
VDGGWRFSPIPRRSKSGCGRIVSHRHSSGLLRIDHYLSVGELPYVALRLTNKIGGAELIGRFATLDEAKAACEHYEPTNGELRFNSEGDPIPRGNPAPS